MVEDLPPASKSGTMRIASLITLLFLLSGCRFFQRQAEDGMTVTAEQFGELQWLAGRWVGVGPDSVPFAEIYVLADDSTFKTFNWKDTTFTQLSDSSALTLRRGQVSSGSGESRWVLTRWDRFGLRFEPRGKATNTFVWRPLDGSTWLATLTWIDADGKKQERVYTMRRWQL
jgi:hypothetical protein